jgi:hypothetical protein
VIGICATAGALVGGYLPVLWGDSGLSFTSLILGAVGGAVGVVVAARLMDL